MKREEITIAVRAKDVRVGQRITDSRGRTFEVVRADGGNKVTIGGRWWKIRAIARRFWAWLERATAAAARSAAEDRARGRRDPGRW